MDERQLQIVLRARDEASRVLRGVADETDGLTSLFRNNYKQAAVMAAGVLAGLGAMTKAAIDNAASYEQNRIAFESMLGSAGKARTLLEEVSAFARKTPFELPQVVEGSKRLIAYGIAMKDVIPTFRMLGDIAAGVGTDKLPQLITAFGQVQAKGKLMGTELLQFTEAGVNLGGQLQKSFGVTREELEKMISSGQVTSAQVTQALRAMTSEGGLFFQGMERQATSFNGVMSNINDSFGRFVRTVVGITEQGDIKEGSLFHYVKLGAERLLPVLDALAPKVAAVIEAILKNREVVVAIAGAITALLVLALVALVAAFGSVLLIIAAVAAAGAAIALMLMTWWDWFQKVRQPVLDLFAAMQAGVSQTAEVWGQRVAQIKQTFQDAIGKLPGIVRAALDAIWQMVLNFNPVIRIGLELPNIAGAFNDLRSNARKLGIPGFAEGTSYAPGGVALVGERGPELVHLPRGSQVIPSHEIGNAGNGPAVRIGTVVIRQDSDIETLARRLDFYRRTGGRG